MTTDLNDAFKANVEHAMRERGITRYHLSRLIGGHPDLVRVQLARPCGVTLATVARYSAALGIPATELITPRDNAAMGERIAA